MKNRAGNAARIFLIDDHPAVRQGLNMLLTLESHIICGEAAGRSETFERIGASGADMALLDLSLGEESGLDCIAGLHEMGIAVLVYSMHDDAATIDRAFAAGAAGYVSKREEAVILLSAVADLLSGKRHVSPWAAQSLRDRALSSPEANRESLLSERERQILSLLGRGESKAVIADSCAISVRTVETYFNRIIDKFKLGGMQELRRYAIRNNRL